jgi:N-acetylglutamate synthase-like GNAT family acetyltransferase
MALKLRTVEQSDYAALATVLAENNLLSGDLDGENKRFFAFEDDSGWRVGVGGLEIYGDVAILRSFLTMSCHRGEGLGAQMLEEVLAAAKASGVRDAYLFTENAQGFFEKQGFKLVRREEAPAAIKASAQFAEHCRTATFMHRQLD